MKKKYYDLYPDTLSMVLTSAFSLITVVLLLVSTNSGNGLILSHASSRQAFLFTPAGMLVLLGCVTMIVMPIVCIRYPEHVAYMLIPISLTGTLFALRTILVQGDVSIWLNMSRIPFSVALIRGLLGIAVIVFMFLLVTNVVPVKTYLLVALGLAIVWYMGTETIASYNGWLKELYVTDTSQSLVLLSQIAYYFSIVFFTFSIKKTDKSPYLIA